MKLTANQLRGIINETVKASKRKRLKEGPVPPTGTTLGSRSISSAVMGDAALQNAISDLGGALMTALGKFIGDETPDGSDLEEQIMTGFENELQDFVEQWAETLSS